MFHDGASRIPVQAKSVGIKTAYAVRGKVAANHRCGWHKAVAASIKYALARTLVVAKDKELILHDRATNRTAKLVAMDLIGFFSEIIRCVKTTVAQKLKHI